MSHHKVEWVDRHREPQCQSDPNFPAGKDIRLTDQARSKLVTCIVALPYPARRCGLYLVECSRCGTCIGVTTAGRPDDPRSVEIPCNRPV